VCYTKIGRCRAQRDCFIEQDQAKFGEGAIMAGESHPAKAVARRFLTWLEIAGLLLVASLGLADRADAMYLHWDCLQAPADSQAFAWNARYSNAGDYIDRTWYYLLDNGQYRYLDNGQYNLMGGLSYLLGHPAYPKPFERDSDQAVGFTNGVNAGWLNSGGGRVTLIEFPVLYGRFNAGDYVDRARYYFLDKGQYDYLDKDQYNLLGGLGYLFGRSYYLRRYDWDSYPLGESAGHPTPEPSTIGFLALGVFALLSSRKRSHSLC
jgi:PEP-CTERM motif